MASRCKVRGVKVSLQQNNRLILSTDPTLSSNMVSVQMIYFIFLFFLIIFFSREKYCRAKDSGSTAIINIELVEVYRVSSL